MQSTCALHAKELLASLMSIGMCNKTINPTNGTMRRIHTMIAIEWTGGCLANIAREQNVPLSQPYFYRTLRAINCPGFPTKPFALFRSETSQPNERPPRGISSPLFNKVALALDKGSLPRLSQYLTQLTGGNHSMTIGLYAHCASNWHESINGCWKSYSTQQGHSYIASLPFITGVTSAFEDKRNFCQRANMFGLNTPPCLATGNLSGDQISDWMGGEASLFSTFIWKPAGGSGGAGIRLIPRKGHTPPPKYRTGVLQGYVDRPILYNGYKTDLRVFAAVTSVKPLRIYISKRGMFRSTFPGKKYDPTHINDLSTAITNCHYGKRRFHFVENKDSSEQEQASFGTLTKFWNVVLPANGLNSSVVFHTLKQKIIWAIAAYHSEILEQNNASSPFFIMFDAIVDTYGNVYLMEADINAYILKERGVCSGSDVVVSSEMYKAVLDGMSLLQLVTFLQHLHSNAQELNDAILYNHEQKFASMIEYEGM
eukprot:scaffold22_cov401-Pavlova_lutheri.AAC.8